MPDRLHEEQCRACEGSGYSDHARMLQDLWYGNLPFDPATTGSTPFTAQHPVIHARAQWSIEQAPDYYLGRPTINWTDPAQHEVDIANARVATLTGYDADRVEAATARQARRLAEHFNSGWGHHLSQDDVDALIADDRLWDFTRTWTKGEGWKRIDPPPAVTAEQVNAWSLAGMGHDSINSGVVIRARCQREGVPETCAACGGDGYTEKYEGQRAEAENWQGTDPPTGDGWQVWESTSHGSPITPVFATDEELATWLSRPDRDDRYAKDWVPYDAALTFVRAGWAPSSMGIPGHGVVSGTEAVGYTLPTEAERET